MHFTFLSAAAFLALGLPSQCHDSQSSSGAQDPVVDLGYSKYRGFTNTTSGYDTYYNLRYAAAPIGNLRWRAPKSPPTVSGIFDVQKKLPTVCPQGIYNGMGVDFETQIGYNISEDCLTVNVYAPTKATKKSKLPVAVFIHGGGYSLGDHNNDDPQAWLDLVPDDVVAVVPNYRLGIFGFLAGEEVKKDGVLNAGLLDQQFFLEWVQKYIHLFGGDPDDVTLWGQSAGAGSVLQHVIANGGKTHPPLFKNAVLNSPFFPYQYEYDHPIPSGLFKELTDAVGCSRARHPLDCLREKPLIPDLRDANIRIAEKSVYGVLTWVPVIDHTFITTPPSKALLPGRPLNGEKVLTTHNTWEGISFAPPTITPANITSFFLARIPTIYPQLLLEALGLYPLRKYESTLQRTQAIIQDPLFVCPSLWLADSFPAGKAWKGTWAVAPASHGQDAGYYFNPNPRDLPSYSTFENWVGAIVGVIRGGDPDYVRYNSAKNPEWTPWKKGNKGGKNGNQKVFYADENLVSRPKVEKVDEDEWKRCEFWRKIGDITGQ